MVYTGLTDGSGGGYSVSDDPDEFGSTDWGDDDDDGGTSSGYVSITNDGTDSSVNDADADDGSDGSDTWGDDSDGSDGGDSFDTDSSTDDDGGDSWTDSGSGGGYTTVTNDGTESTIEDTDPVQGDDASDYEAGASEGIWGESDGGGSESNSSPEPVNDDMEEQIENALAEQRAAFEEDIGALMESLPVPDQLGGSVDGGGLTPALGAVALLAVGGGALYYSEAS